MDVYTRECLGLGVDTSFASRRVTRVLEEILLDRGKPLAIRCENLVKTYPGKPPVVLVHSTVGTANALCGLINASRSNVGHDDRRLADPSVGANVRSEHIVRHEWCKPSVA